MDFSMTDHYDRVRQLMCKIPGQNTPTEVTMPSEETRLLRAKLILEEALETIEGLGVSVNWDGIFKITSDEVSFELSHKPDMIEIVDGCADISVVTTGTLIACGVPDEELLRLVDENNLAKFGLGSYLREDGKWMKPPDHKPPDIKGLLNKLGWKE